METCWYCQREIAGVDAYVKRWIHRVLSQTGARIGFERRLVAVPRCQSCRAFHDSLGTQARVITLTAAVVWFAILTIGMLGAEDPVEGATWGGVALFILPPLAWIVNLSVSADRVTRRASRRAGAEDAFPELAAARSQGWRSGSEPPMLGVPVVPDPGVAVQIRRGESAQHQPWVEVHVLRQSGSDFLVDAFLYVPEHPESIEVASREALGAARAACRFNPMPVTVDPELEPLRRAEITP